jgi:SAM-dependent methyltransferase
MEGDEWPSREDLHRLFTDKYGSSAGIGWSPARRLKAGYYTPADVYEATVAKYVFPGCAWIDVGGGHQIFPDYPKLAATLASRCSAVVAVDPDPAVLENAFVTERYQCMIETYRSRRRFDLATFRMVVEHVTDPASVVQALRGLLRPGGVAIVFTVNRWSPLSLASRAIPFGLHHPIKRLFWGGEERDTFPVRYLMNTRLALRTSFEREGFREVGFAYLDDLSAFGQFRLLGALELSIWSGFNRVGVAYPENCLLGIYRAPRD